MTLMQSPPGATAVIDGQPVLYFVGTGYLGLQGHPEVIRAACEAAEQYGIASATSRTGFGNTPPVLEVDGRKIGSGSLGNLTKRLQGLHRKFAFENGTPLPF